MQRINCQSYCCVAELTSVAPLPHPQVTFSTTAMVDKTSGRMWNMLYMAPEVVMAQPLTEKVDVFAFGIVMYELLTRSLLTVYLTGEDETEEDALVAYATKVADGHREDIPQAWPAEVGHSC
jgi:serine/threonine protein kinase